MTPLELIGVIALGATVGRAVAWLVKPKGNTISLEVATKQLTVSVREAFEAGMLCAADIVTHSGNEKLAGDIRKTVEYVRAENNN